jgi:hypothetical protein
VAIVPHERAHPVQAPAPVESHAEPPTRTKRRARDLDTIACERIREAAYEARASHDWPAVLRATAARGCWSASVDRRRLRVKALAELERFSDCMRAGAGADDPQIRHSVALCRARARPR